MAALIAGTAIGTSNFSLAAERGEVAPVKAASLATPKRLRLLTAQQYVNTIQHYFGPDVRTDVKFAPLARTDGLLMAGTSVAGVSGAQMEVYQKVASIVSAQIVEPGRRESLVPCKPASEKAADDACAGKFLTQVIDNLYFVPPPKAHVEKLVSEAGQAANRLQDFYAGLQVILENVLLSPSMLLIAEGEEPDPKRPGQSRLDAYSLASRLSLFLWDAAPDASLRAAAQRGDLFTERGRARVVDAMLASPRVEEGVRGFFDDMFGLEDLETMNKDANIYSFFVGGAAADAREQTLRTVVDQLLVKDRDYRDLYTSRETFISPALGIVYGVPTTPGWQPIEFPPEAHRGGILTQVSFLALHSHATRSSATLRGKALRELILCQSVPPPPANVDFSALENPDPSIRTARERLGFHNENPVCAGCHKITDPIGLALENYDGAGRYRTTEGGATIDASGNLDGKTYTDAEGLGRALRDSPALPKCLVRRAFGYATASSVPRSLDPVLDHLNKEFATAGYRVRPLLRAIAMSSAFSDVSVSAAKPAAEKAAGLRAPEQVASNAGLKE